MMNSEKFIEWWFGAPIPKGWNNEYWPLQNISIDALKQMLEEYAEQFPVKKTKSLQEFNNYLLDLYASRDSYSRGKLLDLVKDKAGELFGGE